MYRTYLALLAIVFVHVVAMLKGTVYVLFYLHCCRALHASSGRLPRTGGIVSRRERISLRLYGTVDSDEDIELFDENGEENNNVKLNAFNMDLTDDSVSNEEADPGNEENAKKLIECNASILLPFSPHIAFDAFSDLTRQP